MAERADSAPVAGVSRAWWLAAVTLIVGVLLHFSLVIAMMAIPFAVPAEARPAVDRYLVPFFAQDWHLFAPSPDVHDYAVFARGAVRTGERLEWTPWQDLVDPLVRAVQANRLAPEAVSLNLAYKAPARTFDAAGAFGHVRIGQEVIAERWRDLEGQPASVIVLERMASAAVGEAHQGRQFELVQVMITARIVGPGERADGGDGGQVLLLHPVPFQQVARR